MSPDRSERGRSAIRRCPALLAGLMPIALCACAGDDVGDARFPDAPVVLISIDTLRSDRLPIYGYERGSTPAIDALRRDGILAARAYTHVPLTLPAHASLLTGLLPPRHGVRDNSGYRLREDGVASLAPLVKAAGYATGAAISAYVLRAETGLDSGFDLYEDAIDLGSGSGLADQQRAGIESLRASLPWLREAAAQGPFLYWLHLYEPHTPYSPPEPYRSRFASPYDGEIAAADAAVGELVKVLRELEVYDRSLVVVLSDHGEGLGDHGEDEHGTLLYREALQIPLLLKLPGGERAGEVLARPAQLVDVLPTILDVIGLDRPAALDGRSLLERSPRSDENSKPPPPQPGMGQALAEERRAIYAETYYPRLHHGWSELRSAIDRDFHYIEGPAPELYRLSDDPAERRNLLADEPRVAAALRSAIARVAEEPAAPALEDTETRRRLEALGYLSAPARKTAGTVAEPLLDPKAQLPALRALQEARRRFSSGDLDSARRSLEGLVEAQPAMVDAWETLGDVLESGGQLEAAVEARRRAVETSGGAPEQTLKIAPLLLRLGRVEEAKSHARVALDAFPAVARTILARIAMASGDLEEAEREARAAVASRSGTTTPVLTLAEVLAERGDAAGALGVIAGVEDELRTRSLPDPRPFLLRAELLRTGGDDEGFTEALDDAARLADRLLAMNPSAPAGHAARARIYELRGDEERSIEALERALAAGALEDASRPRLALEWSRRGRAGDAAALVEALAGRGDLDAMHALAVARSEEGDQAAARRVLRLALERDPDQTAVLETLGLVELRAGDARAALQPLERATELGVESANAWNLLGVARWQDARDAAGALAAWERALTLDPTRWETLYNLARVASETGRADLARGALERFVAGAPAERYGAELTEARAALAKLGGGAGAP